MFNKVESVQVTKHSILWYKRNKIYKKERKMGFQIIFLNTIPTVHSDEHFFSLLLNQNLFYFMWVILLVDELLKVFALLISKRMS